MGAPEGEACAGLIEVLLLVRFKLWGSNASVQVPTQTSPKLTSDTGTLTEIIHW